MRPARLEVRPARLEVRPARLREISVAEVSPAILASMEDVRFGARVRAVRLRLGWRQTDVAAKAGLSRTTVMRVEHGRLDRLQLASVRAVLRALDMDLALIAKWRGGDLDRLVDEGHATLVGSVAAVLEGAGWVVRAEVSFSVFGERGSIDLLAWHQVSGVLLVVEVKTSLNSIEETLRRQDVKVRLAANVARERFGWDPRATAWLLAVPEGSTTRRRVARHARLLARAYPVRGRSARAWLREPRTATGLLMFLPDAPGESRSRRIAPRRRVRRARPQPSGPMRTPEAPMPETPRNDPPKGRRERI